MNQVPLIVFGVIAQREVDFFLAAAKKINEADASIQIHFISFFQPGNSKIIDQGFNCYDLYDSSFARACSENMSLFSELENQIESLNALLIHEKLTFKTRDNASPQKKFADYYARFSSIITNLKQLHPNKKITVFQELGGFIAPLALYFTSCSQNVRHIFFEPSFFKGRYYFVENSLGPVKIPHDTFVEKEVEIKVKNLLKKITKKQKPVIPDKDAHHFKDMGLSKILNIKNFEKLHKKVWSKYILGHRQEYEHPLHHVTGQLKMLLNRYKSCKLYSNLKVSPGETIVYFPFHVQLDFSLTIRSLEYLDQLTLAQYISRILPKNFKLYLKEHPASVGGFSTRDLKKLLTNDNIALIHPKTNNYQLMRQSDLVITINSKAGAEAAILGKKIITLGESFYSKSILAQSCNNLKDLKALIDQFSKSNKSKIFDTHSLPKFFSGIWKNTYEFELYNQKDENVEKFKNALNSYLELT